MDVLASDFREGQKLFLADPLVQRGVKMLWFDDLVAVRQRERIVRVLFIDNNDWTRVDEEVLIGHLNISGVEVAVSLVDF